MNFIRYSNFKKESVLFVFSIFVLISAPSCFPDNEIDERVSGIRDAKRTVGLSANEILSADQFISMDLEIQYMQGYQPSNRTIENLESWLEKLIHKPAGINIIMSEIPALGQEEYTLQDIRAIEDENRSSYNIGNKLGVYILILDGYFNEDESDRFSFGVSHRNTSLVLLGKRIKENSGKPGRPSHEQLESTIFLHEFGHLLGLVNLGSDMVKDHEDSENMNHCSNEDCLLYWAVETSRIFHLIDGAIPELDQNCLDDLKANGGK
ncbi:MAG: hypothetical protein WD426_17615 [Anditalea sp.]